jgi:hypothetical protein
VIAVPTLVIMAMLATSTSCQPSTSRPSLVFDDPRAPRELHQACALAEDRCSRCHTLERVAHAAPDSPAAWEDQVARMRRMAGSAISRRDGDVITRCLVYRSFGPAGLDALRASRLAGEKGTP